MLKLLRLLFLCIPTIIFAAKFQNYALDSLVIRFDKSKSGYVSYQIPEKEKIFTKEIRELHLLGTAFSDTNKAIIFSDQISEPKSPIEAVANFLFVANSGNKEKLLALHDPSSRAWLDSSLKVADVSQNFFNFWKGIKSIEIKAVFETPHLTILFHKNVTGNISYLRAIYFVKSNGTYKMIAGIVDVGFLQNLQGILQRADHSVIFKKQTDIVGF